MMQKVTPQKLKNQIEKNYLMSVQVEMSNFTDIFDTTITGDVSYQDKVLTVPVTFNAIGNINKEVLDFLVNTLEGAGVGVFEKEQSSDYTKYFTFVIENPTLSFEERGGLNSFKVQIPLESSKDDANDFTVNVSLHYSSTQELGGLSLFAGKNIRNNTLAQLIIDSFLGRYNDLVTMVMQRTKGNVTVVYPDRDRKALLVYDGVVMFTAGSSQLTIDLENAVGNVSVVKDHYVLKIKQGKTVTLINY